MSDSPSTGARPGVPPLAGWETVLLVVVALLAVNVGGLGLASSFEAVSGAGQRWGFASPWMLPIAIDTAIPVFTACHLLLVRVDMPLGWVRVVPWVLTGVTCWLNIAAGKTVSAKVAHGTMPLLWVVFSEVAAHVYATRIGAVTGTRMEKIRRSRWLLAFPSTFGLWRRMTLWEITSYTVALARERERLLARASLREEYGRRWRWRAPRRDRVLLRLGELTPASVAGPQAEPDSEPPREHAAEQPAQARVSLVKPQREPNNPPAPRGPVAAPRTAQVTAARTAAARTARGSTPQEKDAARAWVLARLGDGRAVGWRAVAAEFGRGETWCRARVREAQSAHAEPALDAGGELAGLHLVGVE